MGHLLYRLTLLLWTQRINYGKQQIVLRGICAQNLTIRTCLAAKEAERGSLAAAKGAVKAWLVLLLKRGYIVGDNQLN